jgi:hypothetical protein
LIYVVIIALWAAVLIPIWLRRHDQISEVRSTARFSSAMRSLSGPGARLATDPAFAETAVLERPGMVRSSYPGSHDRRSPQEARDMRSTPATGHARPSEGLDPSYERELARQAASTRRAIVLGVLSLILLAALVMAMVGALPQWTPLVAAVPVLAFVLAAALTRSQRTPASRPARRQAEQRTARREDSRLDQSPTATGSAQPSDDDWENWNAWDDDDAWDAVPATLPTYVTAPRASAVPRGIDRSRPGEWTGEAMVETARSLRRRDSAGMADASAMPTGYGDETTEIPAVRDPYDGRRAANQ